MFKIDIKLNALKLTTLTFRALVASALIGTTVFSSAPAMAIQSANLENEYEVALHKQAESLEALQDSLIRAKIERSALVTITVLSSVAAVITAVPGVVVSYNGVKNLATGKPFMGDPDSGGSLMIPIVIVSSGVSLGSGQAAYQAFKQVTVKSTQINQLLTQIEAKKREIENTLSLISTANKM